MRARHETPALAFLNDAILSNDSLEAVEVSSKAATIVRTVSERVDEFGGAALIADYGNDYPAQDSFRYPDFSLVDKVLLDEPSVSANSQTLCDFNMMPFFVRGFRGHALHDVLTEPGTADLTADVDFSYLKRHCSEHTVTYGPVIQGDFLKALGIEMRLQKLASAASEEARAGLKSAFDMLTSPETMGARFKFMAIFPKTMAQIHSRFPPAGFPPEQT